MDDYEIVGEEDDRGVKVCYCEYGEGKPPYKKQVQLEHISGYMKAKAHCLTCKNIMNKSYKLGDYSQLKSLFHVVGVLELYDCKDTTAKTQIQEPDKQHPSESSQWELFPL